MQISLPPKDVLCVFNVKSDKVNGVEKDDPVPQRRKKDALVIRARSRDPARPLAPVLFCFWVENSSLLVQGDPI